MGRPGGISLANEIQPREALLFSEATPGVGEAPRLRKPPGLVDVEERPAVDLDVPIVGECLEDRIEVPLVVLYPRIGLLDEHPVRQTMPDARPALVRPTETEGELGLSGLKDFPERSFQQSLAREPVVPPAER